jgi:Alpha-L-arabinofuranosidase B, catalytic
MSSLRPFTDMPMKTRIDRVPVLALALTLLGARLTPEAGAGQNGPPPRPNGPCDIYAAAGDPCAAAHSTTRALYASYNGPLYRVLRQSDRRTLDIGIVQPVASPLPDAADTPTRPRRTRSARTRTAGSPLSTSGATTAGAATAVGATAIPVANVTGFSAGQTITIDSGASHETAVVVSTAGGRGGVRITVAAPLTLAHAAGAQISGSGIPFTAALTRAHASGAQVATDVPTPGAPNRYRSRGRR